MYYFASSFPRVLFKIDPEDNPVVPVEVWSAGSIASPVISGAGTCLLFSLTGEGAPFLANPDDIELLATDGDGLSPEQVVVVGEDGAVQPFEMTADGSRIAFPWGDGTWYESLDLFIVDTGTANMTQITDRAGSTNPAISDDGNTIVFFSYEDLVPDGCEVGGIYRINADGSGLQQLSPDPVTCDSYPDHGGDHPSISNDASTVVYQAYPYAQLEGVSSAGGPVWPVTDDDDPLYKTPRIDGTGAWATYMSGSNITGQNPDRGWEVFRVRMDGTGFEQISTRLWGAPGHQRQRRANRVQLSSGPVRNEPGTELGDLPVRHGDRYDRAADRDHQRGEPSAADLAERLVRRVPLDVTLGQLLRTLGGVPAGTGQR